MSQMASGAEVFKADNLDALNLGSSWVGNQAPGGEDVAVWDFTVLTAVPQDVLLGADTSWGGIRIADPGSAVSIGAGNTLTLGALGIDTSLAVQGLTLACPVVIGAPQQWNLTTTVTAGGVLSGTEGNGITLTGPGQLNISGANNSFVEGITVNAGIVNVSVGSSMPIKLNGGQFTISAALGNPVHVVSSGTIRATANRTLSGAITGSGTIITYVTGGGSSLTLNGDMSAFTGTILHGPSSIGSIRANTGAFVGNANVFWDLGPAGGFTRSSSAGRILFGALAGGVDSRIAGGGVVYEIGHLNVDSTFSGDIQNCSIVKVGTGVLTLDGSSSFGGGTTISNGVLQIGASAFTGDAGTGGITNYAALAFNRFDTFTVPNAISGSGSVTNLGFGKTVLAGANTYSGPTTIAAGTLAFGSQTAITGPVIVQSFTTLGATLTTPGATATMGNIAFDAVSAFEFDLGEFANPAAPVASSSGTVTLSGNVAVNVLGSAQSLSVGTFTLFEYANRAGVGSFVQGTLPQDVSGVILDDAANHRVTLTITSVNFVDPTLRWVGDAAGVWDSDNPANQVWRVVGTGQLTNYYFGAAARFDDTATGSTSIDIAALHFPSLVTVSNAAKTYTFGGPGSISGFAELVKQGPGTLNITNANDYAGPTRIEGGTLRIEGETAAIGMGGVTNDGAFVIDKTGAMSVLPNVTAFFGQIAGTGSFAYLGLDQTNSFLELEIGTDDGNPYSGGTVISNGYVRLNANPSGDATRSAAKSTGLGTGLITFLGDSVLELEDWGVGNNSAQAGLFGAPIHVPEGQVGTLMAAGRMTVGSSLSGSGTFNLGVSFVRCVISGDFSAFTGQLNVFPAAAGNQFQVANAAGMPSARLRLTGGVVMGGNAPLPNNSIVAIGELSGEEGTFISTVGEVPRAAVFSVGGLNTSSAFAGSITAHSLTKVGTGTLTLSGTNNTYTGSTTISNGVLALAANSLGVNTEISSSANIAIASPGVLDVTGQTDGTFALGTAAAAQTLLGDGAIQGNVNVGSLGTVTPGFRIGTLTVSGVATLGGTMVMELDRSNGAATNDLFIAPTIAGGGVLRVTNIGPALVVGDTFKLFNQGVSGFTSIELPTTDSTGTAYTWNNNLDVNGTITVATAVPTVDLTPTNIVFSFAGGALDLQWPSSHTGWTLQTNAVGLHATDEWFEFPPGTGSRDTNHVILSVDPTKPNVFYRIIYPQGN